MSRKLSLVAERHPLAAPAAQRARLRELPLLRTFSDVAGPLERARTDVLQLNLGKKCNQACAHCHVDAGPDRKEEMTDAVVDAALAHLEHTDIASVDITGGAPELHPRFESIVERARGLGRNVMDRCNLTVLLLAQKRHLPAFFAQHDVEVVASLPFYEAERTDAQRGERAFERSLEAIRLLNAHGYGTKHTLTLVANPTGAFLPAPQAQLEADFRTALARHGVTFTRLFALANLPVGRTLEWLDRSGNTERYLTKLVDAFNPATTAGLMCRNTLSVSWDGQLFDCDFNQMLELPLAEGPRTIFDLVAAGGRGLPARIATGAHCFGCTAGQGSSCSGALAG
jgi:radical SAM/Cys-rich protein